MNSFKKQHIANNPDKSLSPSQLYDAAQTAWIYFRIERDEARLLKDLTGRLEKLLVRVDAFIEENKNVLSTSMVDSLIKSKTEIDRTSSKSLDADVKKLFKVMSAAVNEINDTKKTGVKIEETK